MLDYIRRDAWSMLDYIRTNKKGHLVVPRMDNFYYILKRIHLSLSYPRMP